MALIPKLVRMPGQGMRDNYDPAHVLQNRAAVQQRRGGHFKATRVAISKKPRVPRMGRTRK
jgi:hypothetical protein